MPGFSQIVGHEETIAHLQTAVLKNRVSHAYIFQGAPGSGKRTLADAFANVLLCDTLEEKLKETSGLSEKDMDACGTCRACRQVGGHNHPDVISITHEKENTLAIAEIREQLIGDIQVRPYYGHRKIYIIPDAELMRPEAQNALLKTLEEPPAYAVILLLTTNASALLETIRSRCVLLDLKPVREDQVMHYLMEHVQIPDYQAKLCASFAQGSIGKAMELATSEDFRELRELAISAARKIGGMDVSEISETVETIASHKVQIRDFLDLLAVWYRDVLVFKATRSPDSLVFKDQIQAVRQSASIISYEGLEAILRALDTAKVRLDANAGFDLTMQLLLLTMHDYSK